jgi:hypothetical protein
LETDRLLRPLHATDGSSVLKGMTMGVTAGTVIGALLALPFAAIHFGDFSLLARLIVVAIAGAVCGATAGWLLFTAFATRRPDEPLAAEHGATLAVRSTPDVEATLMQTSPIRLDVIDANGEPVRSISVGPAEPMLHKLGRHAAEEAHRG